MAKLMIHDIFFAQLFTTRYLQAIVFFKSKCVLKQYKGYENNYCVQVELGVSQTVDDTHMK